MNASAEKLIADAVYESLNGIITQHRTIARCDGKNSVRVKISFAEIRKRVKSRLDGLRGGVDESDDSLAEYNAAVKALRVPTCAKLRDVWLPKVLHELEKVSVTHDAIEFDIVVPPPRNPHAR